MQNLRQNKLLSGLLSEANEVSRTRRVYGFERSEVLCATNKLLNTTVFNSKINYFKPSKLFNDRGNGMKVRGSVTT